MLEGTPIFHLPTGLLLTDICCLDFSWLGLDICWLRHLLISANLPFADSTRTFADPDICWSFLYPPKKTFADPDICWFYQKSHFFHFWYVLLKISSVFSRICEFSAKFYKNFLKLSFPIKNSIKTGLRWSKFIYIVFLPTYLSFLLKIVLPIFWTIGKKLKAKKAFKK